jgi:hypothetical protein
MLVRTPHSRRGKQYRWRVGVWQRADLAELADWVEGLRAAAQKAREDGNLTLAEALDITRFEVYQGYLDEELHQHKPTKLVIEDLASTVSPPRHSEPRRAW